MLSCWSFEQGRRTSGAGVPLRALFSDSGASTLPRLSTSLPRREASLCRNASPNPTPSRARFAPKLASAAALLLLLGPNLPLHAQGCAQCLDSTRATPPAVQSAYRHAIYLLGGAAGTLFVGGTLLLRNRR
jgi:hypothetical protein